MKIAMIGHKRIPSREGGVEIVVEELSTRMVKCGNSVDVYNRKGHHVSGKNFDKNSNLPEYKGIKIITVPTFQNSKLNAMVYSLLATIMAVFKKYDVIHFHAEGPSAMVFLAHLLKKRTVVTIHGLDWQRAKWGGFATKYLLFGEKMAAKYADEIIVLSEGVKNYFFETYGRQTTFIPNGVEKPQIKDNKIINEKFGLKKDSYILFLGRIVPEKGLHYLIKAYNQIDTDKKLVISGGSSHTNEYVNEVKELAKNNKNIIFTDFVEGETLFELFSNAYIYCLPSDVEGMPISLLEAMSYSNCCLVSNINECSEVVENYAETFLHSNIDDLKNKLSYLLNNPDVVKNYKQSATDFICKKYNWNDITKKTLDLYKQK